MCRMRQSEEECTRVGFGRVDAVVCCLKRIDSVHKIDKSDD